MESNRWWETYLVRYVTGSVVGAGIVYGISRVIWPEMPMWYQMNSATLLTLGFAGFAYCYIASAPITFLHAMRVKTKKAIEIRRWLPSVLIIAIFAVIVVIATKDMLPDGTHIFLFLGVCTFFWIFLGYYPVRHTGWEKAYDGIISARIATLQDSKEYVDSYRHLREHGNSFYIVFLEFILAGIIYFFALDEQWLLIALTVFFWVTPGVICWQLGNNLERFMVQKNALRIRAARNSNNPS